MNPTEAWFLHQMVGGGLLLALTAGLMRWARHPEQRQRLAEFGVAAALTLALLCLGPSWLVERTSDSGDAAGAGTCRLAGCRSL
jgi:hypothetical protein